MTRCASTAVAALSASFDRAGLTGAAARDYWVDVERRVRSNPEAVSAALVTAPPLGGSSNRMLYDDAPGLRVLSQAIEPSYFAVMRIPLLRGRSFTARDDPAGTLIVSRRLARAMYGTDDVVGATFPPSRPGSIIVGVASDAHTIEVTATDAAELYAPLGRDDYAKADLLVRARTDPARLVPILTEAANADRRIVAHTRLLREDFDRRTRPARLASTIVGVIGALSLLLACLGVFGVVSYGAALRRKELGIRSALGASRAQLVALMTWRVLTPIVVGAAMGSGAALPLGSALATAPLFLSPFDPAAYVVPLALLVTVTVAAVLLPAVRALRANLLASLRED